MTGASEIFSIAAGPFLSSGDLRGKAAFVGLFLILAVGLALLPRRLIGQETDAPPPWRNVRYWAIAIALAQLLVYAVFG